MQNLIPKHTHTHFSKHTWFRPPEIPWKMTHSPLRSQWFINQISSDDLKKNRGRECNSDKLSQQKQKKNKILLKKWISGHCNGSFYHNQLKENQQTSSAKHFDFCMPQKLNRKNKEILRNRMELKDSSEEMRHETKQFRSMADHLIWWFDLTLQRIFGWKWL